MQEIKFALVWTFTSCTFVQALWVHTCRIIIKFTPAKRRDISRQTARKLHHLSSYTSASCLVVPGFQMLLSDELAKWVIFFYLGIPKKFVCVWPRNNDLNLGSIFFEIFLPRSLAQTLDRVRCWAKSLKTFQNVELLSIESTVYLERAIFFVSQAHLSKSGRNCTSLILLLYCIIIIFLLFCKFITKWESIKKL